MGKSKKSASYEAWSESLELWGSMKFDTVDHLPFAPNLEVATKLRLTIRLASALVVLKSIAGTLTPTLSRPEAEWVYSIHH